MDIYKIYIQTYIIHIYINIYIYIYIYIYTNNGYQKWLLLHSVSWVEPIIQMAL